MNYKELIRELGEDPTDLFISGQSKEATKDSFFLYEIRHMHSDFWESYVWIFDTINEFVNFLPAIIFSEFVIHSEDYDFEEEYGKIDCTSNYEYYQTILKDKWDEARCKKFIDEFQAEGVEFIEFGRVSELLSVSQEEFDLCKGTIDDINILEELGITQGRYKILNNFHYLSNERPELNENGFLSMLNNWI